MKNKVLAVAVLLLSAAAMAAAAQAKVDVTGTVQANQVTFGFGVDVQGTHLDVTYSGTIENQDSMKGTLKLGGLGQGTFTARRQ